MSWFKSSLRRKVLFTSKMISLLLSDFLRVGEKGLNFEKYKTWSTLYNEKINLTYMGKYVCSSKNQAHEGGSKLSSHKQLASLKV